MHAWNLPLWNWRKVRWSRSQRTRYRLCPRVWEDMASRSIQREILLGSIFYWQRRRKDGRWQLLSWNRSMWKSSELLFWHHRRFHSILLLRRFVVGSLRLRDRSRRWRIERWKDRTRWSCRRTTWLGDA